MRSRNRWDHIEYLNHRFDYRQHKAELVNFCRIQESAAKIGVGSGLLPHVGQNQELPQLLQELDSIDPERIDYSGKMQPTYAYFAAHTPSAPTA
jgi:hypothetical protein